MFCANYVNEILSQGLFNWVTAMHLGIIGLTCVFVAFEPLRLGINKVVDLVASRAGNEVVVSVSVTSSAPEDQGEL